MRSAILLGVVVVTWGAPAASKRCIASAEHGQQLRKEGKLIEASSAFRECTANECPAVVRRDCGRWVEELEAAIPTVTFKREDEEGRETNDGRVLVDDRPIQDVSDGLAVPIDPGAHRVTWVRESARIEREVVIREGERGRVVVLRADKPEAPRRPERPLPSEAPASSSSRGPLPWIAGFGGAALVLGGVGLWTVGISERSNLERGCARVHACAEGDVDSSRTKLVIGDVLVGAGVLAIGAAVWLFLHSDAPRSPGTAAVNF